MSKKRKGDWWEILLDDMDIEDFDLTVEKLMQEYHNAIEEMSNVFKNNDTGCHRNATKVQQKTTEV